MMTCRRISDILVDFLEGDLCAETRDGVMRHLGTCEPCLLFVETYKKTSALCRKTMLKQVPPEFEDKLSTYLRQATAEKQRQQP